MIKYFQKGFNYNHDGPGNRLVIHLNGCNMHCPWCANPEGIAPFSEKMKTIAVDELVAEIISCKSLFFDGGGVTFTGGEATIQFDELKATLKLLKQHGVNTAIETNGTHQNLASLFEYIDILIIDLKHVNSQIHEKTTGIASELILKNIEKASLMHPNVIIRITLVNGFNASENNLAQFLDFAKTINAKFEFLTYHEYGKGKWKELNMPYTVGNGFVSKETLAMFVKAFEENNIATIQT